MRVVITGATGNVGTSLIEALEDDEHVTSIVGLARRPTGAHRAAIDLTGASPAGEWHPARTDLRVADVSRDRLDGHIDGADALVHLAWLMHPAHHPIETWRNNVIGASRVLAAAARAGVATIIHASSVAAYSAAPGDTRVTESWPTHSLPTVAVGREKAYVERLLDVFERDHPGIRVVRMRPAFTFKREAAIGQRRLLAGPLAARWPPARRVRPPGSAATARRGVRFLPLVPGLRFQALHTSDVADAYRRALHRPVRGAFNLAADPVIELRTVAELLGATPVPVPSPLARSALAALHHLHVIPAPPELLDLVMGLPLLDTTRARTELGWRPRHGGLDALAELISGLHDETGFRTPPLAPAGAPAVPDHVPLY